MRTKKFLAFMAMGIIALAQVGCGSESNGGDEPKPTATGVVLDNDTINIEVGETATLVATIQPEGAEGTVLWNSANPSTALVVAGEVRGVKKGQTIVSAALGAFSATCVVNVTPKTVEVGEALKGSDYHLIFLGEQTAEEITGKIKVDARVNQTSTDFYIWPDGTSFDAGNPSGTNFAGKTDGWMSFKVANLGWSGGGFAVMEGTEPYDFSDVTNNPDDYDFHIALKSSQENSSYLFTIGSEEGGTTAKICIGSAAVDGVQPYANITRDGEWNSIVIPVSELVELGCGFSAPITKGNIVAVSAGAVEGTTLDMDGIFFYKPAQE